GTALDRAGGLQSQGLQPGEQSPVVVVRVDDGGRVTDVFDPGADTEQRQTAQDGERRQKQRWFPPVPQGQVSLVSAGAQFLHGVGVLGEQWVQEGGEQASQDAERGQHHGGCLEQWAGGVDLRVGNVLL